VTITPGNTDYFVSITTTDDLLDEPDEETFNIIVGTYGSIADGTGVGTIQDNEATPQVNWTLGGTSFDESIGLVTLQAYLDVRPQDGVTITYTVSGTSEGAPDHDLVAGSVTFASADTMEDVVFSVVDDLLYEGDETVIATIDSAANATLGATLVSANTILDNEAYPHISINDLTQIEGTTYTFTALMDTRSEATITFDWLTSDGAALAGAGINFDYTASSGSITFTSGNTENNTDIVVISTDDPYDEVDNEEFYILLSNISGTASFADDQGIGTIQDNDLEPAVYWDLTLTSSSEAAGLVSILARLDVPSNLVATVDFTISGGATTGLDHTLAADTITFAAGVTTNWVSFSILEDLIDELDEDIVVTMVNPSNATLNATNTIHTEIIVDNDDAQLQVTDAGGTEGNTLTFEIWLDKPASQDVVFNWTASDATAGAPLDYSRWITPVGRKLP
jgi:hypothetical protein